MNIKEYISSGILEAYALGDVSSTEREEIERYLKQYPELQAELTMVEKTMEAFALNAAVQPKTSVRKSIMDNAEKKATNVVALPSTSVWRYATAASIAIALLTSYVASHYYSKWEETSFALGNLIAQNQQIAQDYNVVNQKLNKIQNDFSIIENTAFTKIVMSGTANAPEAKASVYWNPGSQDVYLSIQNLKTISESNQFQLWAIVEGKPINAGVFDANVDGLLRMKPIAGAVAFAVTIEPRGGKPSPTLETMQLMGTIPKG